MHSHTSQNRHDRAAYLAPTRIALGRAEQQSSLRIAGEEQLLSKVVNVAIKSPLYPLMKVLAKRVMKQTAEGRGVPWGRNIEQLTARLQVLGAARVLIASADGPDYALDRCPWTPSGGSSDALMAALTVLFPTSGELIRGLTLRRSWRPSRRNSKTASWSTLTTTSRCAHMATPMCSLFRVACREPAFEGRGQVITPFYCIAAFPRIRGGKYGLGARLRSRSSDLGDGTKGVQR